MAIRPITTRISLAILCALLFYSFWHGSLPRVQIWIGRIDALHGRGPFGVSANGWVNLIAIGAAFLALLTWSEPVIRAVRRGKDWFVYLPALLWPLLAVLNFRAFNKDSVFAALNAGLLGALLLVLWVSSLDEAKDHWIARFRQKGLKAFTLGALLGIGLPLIAGYEWSWFWDSRTFRFLGFTAGPSVIGFSSVALVAWGIFAWLDDRKISPVWLPPAALILGICGIYLAALRIAVLAVLVLAVSLGFLRWRRLARPQLKILAAVALVMVGTQFTPKYLSKWVPEDPVKRPQVVAAQPKIDRIVHTNGRGGLYQRYFEHVKQSPWIGHGSGSAETIEDSSSPHSDYLRILVEHGIVGLAIFAWLGIGLFIRARNTVVRSGLITLALLLATDNFLIYPIFGYLPFLLALIAFCELDPAAVESSA